MPKCTHCAAAGSPFACAARARPVPRLCDLTDPAHPDYNPDYAAVVRRWTEEDRAPIEFDDRPALPPLPAPPLPVRPPTPRTYPAGPTSRVVIRTYLNALHGYTQIAEGLGRGLEFLRIPVAYWPISRDETYASMPRWQVERIDDDPAEGWTLQLAVPTTPPPAGRRVLAFSMWEATRLLPGAAEALNAAETVCVPCTWNRDVFIDSGVTRPVHVVPMGIDPGEYHPGVPMAMGGPTVFGMAARVRHGPIRKGLHEGIEAFRRAFPRGDEAVELRIKVLPDCPLDDPHIPRVTIDRTPMGPDAMRAWYAGLTALFVGSKGEGWGLHSLQALACGRPIIAALETGTRDFATEACCYPLDGAWGDAGEFYATPGAQWFVPSIGSMVEQLRRVHSDRDEARAKGQAGAKRALEFTWRRSGIELRNVLTSVGMLAPKPRASLGTRVHRR